jgi:hypothetical protein
MPRETTHLAKQDRRYMKFKMRRIKRAKLDGNEAAAQRHATELLQYFNVGDNETPISDALELSDGLDQPFRDRVSKLQDLSTKE